MSTKFQLRNQPTILHALLFSGDLDIMTSTGENTLFSNTESLNCLAVHIIALFSIIFPVCYQSSQTFITSDHALL